MTKECNEEEEDGEDGENGAPHILAALQALPLFEEVFLRMQATNISIVDGLIEQMESDLLHELVELERTPVASAMTVSAMSQMWMFAVYELLRTWRQRIQVLLRIADRVATLVPERREAFLAEQALTIGGGHGDASLALDLQRSAVMDLVDEGAVARLRDAYLAIEPVFRRVESLRITLAKHEIPKANGLVAFAPGYGRIDYLTGSIYWQIDLKDNTVDVINRRAVADELRRVRVSET